jgi:NTE family protein
MRPTLLLFLTVLPAQGQASSSAGEPGRPKVCVALSGGGALGLAHVGVLRWLDDNRIPVDCVAGTSMGGLIGGLFATGHTPDDITAFLERVDWNMALAPAPPFPQLAFRRKEDARDFPNQIEFGYKKGVQLPSGLSPGHYVGLVLNRFAAPWSDLGHFDELPTPLRTVATDLVSGKEVLFDRGPLFDALRATMSLPALFAPVRSGEKLLVDGGLVNNIPVDLARGMGADIVIAVALQKPPSPGDFKSLLGTARRSIAVMVEANERVSLGKADLVIMPDLSGFSATDYPRHNELAGRGYSATESKRKMLAPLAMPADEYDAWRRRRAGLRRRDEFRPEVFELDPSIPGRLRAALIENLQLSPAKTLDRQRLEDQLTKLTGTGRYSSASYSFATRDGKQALRITAAERDHGPPFLRIGFDLDATPDYGLRFGVGGRLTFLDAGGPASEWRTDFSIGTLNYIGTEYYYRLRGGKWFLAPRLGHLAESQRIYEEGREIASLNERTSGGAVDLGYAFGRFQELRLGYGLSNRELSLTRGVPVFEDRSGRYSDLHARWIYEGQDAAIIPQRGIRAQANASWVLDQPAVNSQYPVLEGQFGWARQLRGRQLMLLRAAGGSTVRETGSPLTFSVGGPGRIAALARNELFGSNYYFGSASLLRSITSQSLSLFGRFYLSASYEVGTAWYAEGSRMPRHSGALGLIGETPLGVVYFGGAIGDRGHRKVFFRLGRFF